MPGFPVRETAIRTVNLLGAQLCDQGVDDRNQIAARRFRDTTLPLVGRAATGNVRHRRQLVRAAE